MQNLKIISILVVLIIIGFAIFTVYYRNKNSRYIPVNFIPEGSNLALQNPLSIEAMRSRSYPGSDIKIEQTLNDGSSYHQYIGSYMSDGLKIYGLLTVPNGNPPSGGWPAIIINHGYIPPGQYRTTERYVAYVDAFARNGYVVFKSDYRGNGSSEGQPEGAYYSPAYTTDVLNALASVKKMKGVNPDKIGMWGHSMGGNITLRALVVDLNDIKAAVVWGGVVGTYDELVNDWHNTAYRPGPSELALRNRYRQNLINQYGNPKDNPAFWKTLDPNSYLSDILAPIQLDYGSEDEEVPVSFSEGLYNRLKQAGKTAESYSYIGADHNISQNLDLVLSRSVNFFNKYLKP